MRENADIALVTQGHVDIALELQRQTNLAGTDETSPGVRADETDVWTDEEVYIPRQHDPRRPDWNRRYLEAVKERYWWEGRNKLVAIDVEIKKAALTNSVMNKWRYKMYRRMLKAGEPLPPLVVVRDPTGHLRIVDGNHRAQAAMDEGVKTLVAVEIVPV